MGRTISAAHVNYQLKRGAFLVAQHREVSDADTSASSAVQERVQWPNGGQPGTPVNKPHEAIAPERHAEVGELGFHGLGVAAAAGL